MYGKLSTEDGGVPDGLPERVRHKEAPGMIAAGKLLEM
jgi:hypothetical protein